MRIMKIEYYINKIEENFIPELYLKYLKGDFPVEERKPLKTILYLIEKGYYECYGLYKENELIAYALLAAPKECSYVLLEYYAVIPQYRNQGIGSTFISLLTVAYQDHDGILVESEAIAYTNEGHGASDKITRERRIRFYLENGFYDYNLIVCLFNVYYSILFLPIRQIEDRRMEDRPT